MGESLILNPSVMTKRILTAFALLLCISVEIEAATVTRHGVSIEYDPAMFSEVFCNEWARSPRPRPHVWGPGDDFRSGELDFVFKTPSPIGSVIVSLTPTAHRSPEYFDQTYPHIAARIRALKDVLRERRPLPQRDENRRAIHPIWQHAVYLVSRLRYFDFSWGSATALLEFDAQDAGNVAGYDPGIESSRLSYAMYGLTADQRFYVSGSLDVVHPELERREHKRLLNDSVSDAEYDAYLDRATRLTEQSREESFSPSLTVLHNLMGSLTIDPQQARPDKWHRFRTRRGIAMKPE